MKQPVTLKTALILAGSLAFIGTTHAATYLTTFFGSDDNTISISRIELLWTTEIVSGNAVTVADLSDLRISFFDESDALVFTDHAIIGGGEQSISGISRQAGDIEFNATSGVSDESVAGFDNATAANLLNGSSGTTYNIYGPLPGENDALVINLARYQAGSFADNTVFTVAGQNTVAVIPEPSACAALAGLLGLGFAATRRRRLA